MIDELLQDRAALYVSGAMTAQERDDFELILEFHDEVRQFVRELNEVGTALLLSGVPSAGPSAFPGTEVENPSAPSRTSSSRALPRDSS